MLGSSQSAYFNPIDQATPSSLPHRLPDNNRKSCCEEKIIAWLVPGYKANICGYSPGVGSHRQIISESLYMTAFRFFSLIPFKNMPWYFTQYMVTKHMDCTLKQPIYDHLASFFTNTTLANHSAKKQVQVTNCKVHLSHTASLPISLILSNFISLLIWSPFCVPVGFGLKKNAQSSSSNKKHMQCIYILRAPCHIRTLFTKNYKLKTYRM